MRLNRLNVSALRPVRFLLAVCVGAIMLFSYALPAYSGGFYSSDSYKDPAINTTPTSARQGEAFLEDIRNKSEDILKQPPPSMEKQQAETEPGGLNVVQGTGDYEKMHRPENSQNAKSAEQSVEEGLKKLVNRD